MGDAGDKVEHHGTGHRSRLRSRLLEQGGDTLLELFHGPMQSRVLEHPALP